MTSHQKQPSQNVFYEVRPEVPGGFGDKTILATRRLETDPHHAELLHFEFEDWFGDSLITSSPEFLVERNLLLDLRRLGATGWETYPDSSLIISVSENYATLRELGGRNPAIVPDFVWLKITGSAGDDDWGLENQRTLVLSERLFWLLSRNEGLSQAEVLVR